MIGMSAAEILSFLLLALVLAAAVIRPWGWPEALVAVPAAAVATATGMVSTEHARAEVQLLGPVVGFLAAVLVLAKLCDDEGLFRACGAWMARGAAGRPRRLLAQVFLVASLVTAVLSLDATVVLLTPVVLVTAGRLRTGPRAHLHACAHLSNTASLLLPVSNLTNLLAFAACGLSFSRFGALMLLPWLLAIGVEYAVHRRFFATELDAPPRSADTGGTPEADPPLPLFALLTVVATLGGFVLASALGVNPAWAALAGATVLSARALLRRETTTTAIVRSAGIPFLAFVLALGIVVRAVVDNGLGSALGRVVPTGTSLPALLAIAALAAVLANVINNLPAVLVLIPLLAPSGAGALLAVLLGVNIGPNLSYAGSLATLLWRRILRDQQVEVKLGEFTRLGLLTVPPALVLSVVALWSGLRLIGT
jgi:arsenical pump membrane protein